MSTAVQFDLEEIKKAVSHIQNTPKRGRPRGEWKAAKLGRHSVREWKPIFNQIVFDSIGIPGVTYEELGKKYGYTKEHICNILNTEQAQVLKESVGREIVKQNMDRVPVKIAEIQSKIVERLHSFIHNDHAAEASPFAFIDKTLSIGKAIGSLKSTENPVGGHTTNNTQNNVVISTEAAIELSKSINLSDRLQLKPIEAVPLAGSLK